ncbi:cation:proton antiporter domain-containing protein [Mesoterricola sediminis]|uniref:Cation/H+ exchanger transmembrane domain-containing protein n=1 Tax=Mesoterricola sediminis TaxID=2927980 RepID=A0AA48KET3_9BACT|nr:cation:proton antiporter [Mesoterricola sediminis]BDU78380.1 hypothetical protein METESE_33380 [Mesoterricola sediminis]
MTLPAAVALLGLLVFLAHALEAIFQRTKVPDVLFLMGLGLLLGPATGLLRPEALGAAGPLFTTAALVAILFEGGLGLDLPTVARSIRGATGLTLWNFLGTLAVAAPLAKGLLGLTWLQAATVAACLGGTSSAVVIPLVRRFGAPETTRAALALESALSDVLVIIVALGLMNAQAAGRLHLPGLLGDMAGAFTVAAILGLAAGLAWSLLLDKVRAVRHSLFTTPAFVFVVYGAVEALGASGAIAALVMGLVLGNAGLLPGGGGERPRFGKLAPGDRQVFAEAVFLMKTFLFVYVGLSIRFSGTALALAGLALAGAVLLVRVPAVRLSLPPGGTDRSGALVASAMGAKGLAAAVVASIPLQMGLPRAEEIRLVVFAVVFFSILASSLLLFLQERGWLRLPGRILFGAYPEAR